MFSEYTSKESNQSPTIKIKTGYRDELRMSTPGYEATSNLDPKSFQYILTLQGTLPDPSPATVSHYIATLHIHGPYSVGKCYFTVPALTSINSHTLLYILPGQV